MKKLTSILIKSFIFFAFFSTSAFTSQVGIEDAKKYAQDLPKLMMGGKKNKKLIDSALIRIEEECCSEKFTDKQKIETRQTSSNFSCNSSCVIIPFMPQQFSILSIDT